jgi:hypothetical protein
MCSIGLLLCQIKLSALIANHDTQINCSKFQLFTEQLKAHCVAACRHIKELVGNERNFCLMWA